MSIEKLESAFINLCRYSKNSLPDWHHLSIAVLILSQIQALSILTEQCLIFINATNDNYGLTNLLQSLTIILNFKDIVDLDMQNKSYVAILSLILIYEISLLVTFTYIFLSIYFRFERTNRQNLVWGLVCMIHEKVLFMPIFGYLVKFLICYNQTGFVVNDLFLYHVCIIVLVFHVAFSIILSVYASEKLKPLVHSL